MVINPALKGAAECGNVRSDGVGSGTPEPTGGSGAATAIMADETWDPVWQLAGGYYGAQGYSAMKESKQIHSERRFQELLEAAPDAIIEVDEGGHILLLNRAAEITFGYSREELLGQPVEVLIPAEFRFSHVGHRSRYRHDPVRRPMGSGMLLEGVRKDGTRFPTEISLSPSSSDPVRT